MLPLAAKQELTKKEFSIEKKLHPQLLTNAPPDV